MSYLFTLFDYFKSKQNVETLNKWIDEYIKNTKSSASILEAVKSYYGELKDTHFGMFIPYFNAFIDIIINSGKLNLEYVDELKKELNN
jgi:hypothetical protein